MYSVSIKSLSKSFGATPVLRNVNLEIAKGEFFFLLGPSGCGKTTLLRILAGFEQPESGAVLFDGHDVTRLPPQKRRVSLVFQNYALWPHMTVRQNVAFGLENQHLSHEQTSARVGDMLKLVRMEKFADRLPGQLSGGQQQRIALARALVVQPELVLMDEPLSNLDARLRAEMRVELARVHKETGVTLVYVTHDQEEALSLADRIAFMDDQNIAQVGTPRELYLRPTSLKTARFLGDANTVEGTCSKVTGTRVVVETLTGHIIGHCPEGKIPAVGTTATAVFRPERLTLAASTGNTFKARVISAFYHGATEVVVLDVQGQRMEMLVVASEETIKPGDEVIVGVREEDVLVLE